MAESPQLKLADQSQSRVEKSNRNILWFDIVSEKIESIPHKLSMKLVCSQSDLNTHLSLTFRAVPSRPTHPILANVLLQADAANSQVSLTAFDLSLGIRTTFNAEVLEGGTITLPAKLLNDIVSRLPEGEITLGDELPDKEDRPVGEGLTVTLTPKSGRYEVRAMGAEEFPELPVTENDKAIHLPASALIEGLGGSLFATSADESKQVLTGVHLTVKQDSLEFAATDGTSFSSSRNY